MSSSHLWERSFVNDPSPPFDWERTTAAEWQKNPRKVSRYWMLLDGLTILAAAIAATLYKKHIGFLAGLQSFWHDTLIPGSTSWEQLIILFGFTLALIETSRRMHLYTPLRLGGFLAEQRSTIQACLISGLLLTGSLYLVHAGAIPRSIVLLTLGIVMVSLSLRRLIFRAFMHRAFERGIGTRNVLIVGTGPEARAFRRQLTRLPHLGYSFKGFIELSPSGSYDRLDRESVVGTLASLFDYARKHFVDEIFIAGPCKPGVVPDVCEKARAEGIDLRVIPDMYGGLAWKRQIEYIGEFPTIPLHCSHFPELALMFKRSLDIIFAASALLILSPVLLLISIAIKLDSPGPILFVSERIGKKGRVFGCIKFRTMVQDAEKKRSQILSMNERDGILFKVKNDPRVTRLGRILRKYSLDEIPQFLNVIGGDMSIVGPRPPIAREVREYELKHLRRLDVVPGITGLWQIQARQDPSFESYIMLDLAYIENWSVWLDLKIILRTVGVVVAGTGS
jgi:exopolysaccharide biosynthesis polyprenyl glycosylphosphotransferase